MELTRLEDLTLADNRLQGTPFDDELFGVGQRQLKRLDLSGNQIQGEHGWIAHLERQWVRGERQVTAQFQYNVEVRGNMGQNLLRTTIFVGYDWFWLGIIGLSVIWFKIECKYK